MAVRSSVPVVFEKRFEKRNEMKEKTLVKICGLRRPADAQAANRVLPDFAGFILSPGFRRSIGLEQAVRLRGLLDPRIRTVGVYVDADPEEIIKAAASGAVNLIQLHGKEDDEYIERIILRTSLPVIKAFRIGEKSDLEQAGKCPAQWILLDSGTGTGKSFDWELLASFLEEHGSAGKAKSPESLRYRGDSRPAGENLFPGNHPWLLAGGLSTENVAAAVMRFCPTAVDVSSKVETDGWKDPEKIRAFTEAVRRK